MFLKKALLFEQCSTLLTFESVSECCVRCKRLLGCQGHLAFLALEVVLGSLVHLQRSCIVAFEVAIFALVHVRFHVARHLVPKCKFIRRNNFSFVIFKLFLYLGIFWRQVGHLSVWTLTIFTADWKIVIIVCEKYIFGFIFCLTLISTVLGRSMLLRIGEKLFFFPCSLAACLSKASLSRNQLTQYFKSRPKKVRRIRNKAVQLVPIEDDAVVDHEDEHDMRDDDGQDDYDDDGHND